MQSLNQKCTQKYKWL